MIRTIAPHALESEMPQELAQSDLDAIERARASFLTGMANDDAGAMAALLTEDGTAFPPNEEALVGRDANRAWHEERIAEFETEFTTSTDELFGEGSMAFERFSYTLKLTPKAGGEPVEDSGRCIWLWKREGDDWKVARAMWNSPEPTPTE